MSEWVETPFGKVRRVQEGVWAFEVPGCGKTERLNEEQFHGRLSVNHTAVCSCGYHETHDFSQVGSCPNGPDEHGNYPCEPKGYFGIAECQVCGRIGTWPA